MASRTAVGDAAERLPLLGRGSLDSAPGAEDAEADARWNDDMLGPFKGTPNTTGPIGSLFANHYFKSIGVLFFFRIALSIANRVSYKIMLVPMAGYEYFLSLLMSFVYVLYYAALFTISYKAGWVTDRGIKSRYAMGVPKGKLIVMGACDCFGSVIGIISAQFVPGSVLTVLSTLVTPFTMITSFVYLKSRYSLWQVLAAMIVISGNLIIILGSRFHTQPAELPTATPTTGHAAAPEAPSGVEHSGAFVAAMALLNVVGLIPNAVSYTIKESIFGDLPGVNVLVINLWSSLFAVCFMPFAFVLSNIPGLSSHSFSDIPTTVPDGFSCFGGVTPANAATHTINGSNVEHLMYHTSMHRRAVDLAVDCVAVSPHAFEASRHAATVLGRSRTTEDCSPMPFPWLIYAVFNVAFNICILLVVKYGGGRPVVTPTGVKTTTSGTGAVVNFLVGMVGSGLTFFAFGMPADWFPSFAQSVHNEIYWYHYTGLAVAVVGLSLYQWVSRNFRAYKADHLGDPPGCFSLMPAPWKLYRSGQEFRVSQ